MYSEEISFDNDETTLKKVLASMHITDEKGTPRVIDGHLILTNKKLIFSGPEVIEKITKKGIAQGVSLAQRLGFINAPSDFSSSPFHSTMEGANIFPLYGIEEVGKGGRSIRSLGMQRLRVMFGGYEFIFHLAPIGDGGIDDWIKAMNSAINNSPAPPVQQNINQQIESHLPGIKTCWLQGTNGSFDTVEKGTLDLDAALKGIDEFVSRVPLPSGDPEVCPFTLGFSDDDSSIGFFRDGQSTFFFRALYGNREYEGSISLDLLKDYVADYFNGVNLGHKTNLNQVFNEEQTHQYCTKCGNQIRTGIKFCTGCGSPI